MRGQAELFHCGCCAQLASGHGHSVQSLYRSEMISQGNHEEKAELPHVKFSDSAFGLVLSLGLSNKLLHELYRLDFNTNEAPIRDLLRD